MHEQATRTLHVTIQRRRIHRQRILARKRAAARRAQAQTAPSSAPSGQLQAIAQCESGGDPSARSGQFGGKYQFDQQTWASVGGTGDPAAAPASEQDMRAQMLLDRQGTTPWPVCGR